MAGTVPISSLLSSQFLKEERGALPECHSLVGTTYPDAYSDDYTICSPNTHSRLASVEMYASYTTTQAGVRRTYYTQVAPRPQPCPCPPPTPTPIFIALGMRCRSVPNST